MDGRLTNQLHGLGRNIISIIVEMLTGVLWTDMREQCGSHLTTAMDADPLRKRRLLSTFSVNGHLLQYADIGYLGVRPLSALRNYRRLMPHLSSFPAGFPAWGSRGLNVHPLRWSTSWSLTWMNLVSAETAFTGGITMGRYACSNELLLWSYYNDLT